MLEARDQRRRITVLSLERTGQDLCQGRIVFRTLPSFTLVVQYDGPRAIAEQEEYAPRPKRKVMDHSRLTYTNVHSKPVSPETLDEYGILWECDEVSY
jgi:hypothetical protein